MAKLKVVLERIDTIAKQAEIMVEANSAAEALQQITYDLDSDPGAYDSDLQPIEDGVGEITKRWRSNMSARTFPGPWRVETTEGGHFVVKDATGSTVEKDHSF